MQDLKIVCNFAPVKNRNMRFLARFSSVKSSFRKDGRVVDYTGLENRRAERHRGFESLSFRNAKKTSLVGVFFRVAERAADENPRFVIDLQVAFVAQRRKNPSLSARAIKLDERKLIWFFCA